MSIYMVERDLPGITMDQLAAAQSAAKTTAGRLRDEGVDVRYVRSTFVPGESRCMCLFEAPDADTVARVNDEAQLPYSRVIEALDLS
jgi:muconolactone delta-isomerase